MADEEDLFEKQSLNANFSREESAVGNTGYKTFYGQNMSSSITRSQADQFEDSSFRQMPSRKKWSFVAFFFADFCAGIFYSLLGPFFPNQAESKGLSSTVTGFVFSIYPVMYIITSPLIGRFLGSIGAKFVLITGIFVCGTCAILFGCLEYTNDGTVYAVMCILVRAVQGLGGASLHTATFAMVATMFPAQMATMFGLLEVAFGLGTMLGPAVGGWLFELGGFKTPFVVAGSILLLTGVVCYVLVPSVEGNAGPEKRSSLWTLLLSPLVVVVGLTGAVGQASVGFLDVTLSVRLSEKFNLTPGWTGLVFFIAPGTFILSAPVWGRLADLKPKAAPVAMGTGTIIGGLGFWFLGPAPFLHIPDKYLWLLMLTYGIMGLTLGTHVVNGKIMAEEARKRGHTKGLETMAMLSGLISSFNSAGSFFGPLVGGYLNDRFKFPMATVIIGSIVMFVGTVLLLCVTIQYAINRRQSQQALNEESLLLADDSLSSSVNTTPAPNSRVNSESAFTPGPPSTALLFIRKHGIVTPNGSPPLQESPERVSHTTFGKDPDQSAMSKTPASAPIASPIDNEPMSGSEKNTLVADDTSVPFKSDPRANEPSVEKVLATMEGVQGECSSLENGSNIPVSGFTSLASPTSDLIDEQRTQRSESSESSPHQNETNFGNTVGRYVKGSHEQLDGEIPTQDLTWSPSITNQW